MVAAKWLLDLSMLEGKVHCGRRVHTSVIVWCSRVAMDLL